VRFAFLAEGTFYTGGFNVGWAFSNVTFANVSELTLDNWTTLPSGSPSQALIASAAGSYILTARTQYQGTYFGDLGPGVALQVSTSMTACAKACGAS
jgi:hypothetical protein